MAGNDYEAGMSNNAVYAYEDGLLPLSKITRSVLNRIGCKYPIVFAKWVLKEKCGYAEKHHCSGMYNLVEFYDPTELKKLPQDKMDEYRKEFNEMREKIKKEREEMKSQKGVRVRGRYKQFSRSRRRSEVVGYIEFEGYLKGNVIYMDNGRRKKANGKHIEYEIIDEKK